MRNILLWLDRIYTTSKLKTSKLKKNHHIIVCLYVCVHIFIALFQFIQSSQII